MYVVVVGGIDVGCQSMHVGEDTQAGCPLGPSAHCVTMAVDTQMFPDGLGDVPSVGKGAVVGMGIGDVGEATAGAVEFGVDEAAAGMVEFGADEAAAGVVEFGADEAAADTAEIRVPVMISVMGVVMVGAVFLAGHPKTVVVVVVATE